MMDRNTWEPHGFDDDTTEGVDVEAVRTADRLLDSVATGQAFDGNDPLARLLADARAESARNIPAAPVVGDAAAAAAGADGSDVAADEGGDADSNVVPLGRGRRRAARRAGRAAAVGGVSLTSLLVGSGVAAALVVGGFTVGAITSNSGDSGNSGSVVAGSQEPGSGEPGDGERAGGASAASGAPGASEAPGDDEGDRPDGDDADPASGSAVDSSDPADGASTGAGDIPDDGGMVIAGPGEASEGESAPEQPGPTDTTDGGDVETGPGESAGVPEGPMVLADPQSAPRAAGGAAAGPPPSSSSSSSSSAPQQPRDGADVSSYSEDEPGEPSEGTGTE